MTRCRIRSSRAFITATFKPKMQTYLVFRTLHRTEKFWANLCLTDLHNDDSSKMSFTNNQLSRIPNKRPHQSRRYSTVGNNDQWRVPVWRKRLYKLGQECSDNYAASFKSFSSFNRSRASAVASFTMRNAVTIPSCTIMLNRSLRRPNEQES